MAPAAANHGAYPRGRAATHALYVAKDMRAALFPHALGLPDVFHCAFRADPPATAVTVAPVWRLTPALLAVIWHQCDRLDARTRAGEVSPAKARLAADRFDVLMRYADGAWDAGETARWVGEAREGRVEVPEPPALAAMRDPCWDGVPLTAWPPDPPAASGADAVCAEQGTENDQRPAKENA